MALPKSFANLTPQGNSYEFLLSYIPFKHAKNRLCPVIVMSGGGFDTMLMLIKLANLRIKRPIIVVSCDYRQRAAEAERHAAYEAIRHMERYDCPADFHLLGVSSLMKDGWDSPLLCESGTGDIEIPDRNGILGNSALDALLSVYGPDETPNFELQYGVMPGKYADTTPSYFKKFKQAARNRRSDRTFGLRVRLPLYYYKSQATAWNAVRRKNKSLASAVARCAVPCIWPSDKGDWCGHCFKCKQFIETVKSSKSLSQLSFTGGWRCL